MEKEIEREGEREEDGGSKGSEEKGAREEGGGGKAKRRKEGRERKKETVATYPSTS